MNRVRLTMKLRSGGRSQILASSCQSYVGFRSVTTSSFKDDHNPYAGSIVPLPNHYRENGLLLKRPLGMLLPSPFSKGIQTDARTRSPAVEKTEVKEENDPPKEFSEMPGPKPWPLVGNIVQLMMRKDFDTTRFDILWSNLFKEYGPILKLSFPGSATFVTTMNPDDIETFMKSSMDNPIRESFEALKIIRNNAPNNYFQNKTGLLPENGAEWGRLRSRVQGPLLKPRNVAAYLPMVDKATLAYMERIDLLQEKTGQVPDYFLQDLYKWALECVGHVALNKELFCLEPGQDEHTPSNLLIQHTNEMLKALNIVELGLPLWRLFRTPAYKKLETAQNAFIEVADKSIQEAIISLEEAKAKGDPDRTLSVMETFLNTEGLSKSDVTTMILDMLFAGIDTTSHTLAFTLYLLAKNPAAQQKLQEEVDAVLEDAPDLQPSHISRMIFLHNVVKESMRMHPVTITKDRILTEEIVMSGYKVPAGVNAMGWHMLICRDEKYFSQPREFLPERWGRDRPHGPIHPYASLPFSHGKRMCIGKRIAEQEIYAFLIRVMQKYSVTFESNDEMEVKTQLLVTPTIPLPFKFHHRK